MNRYRHAQITFSDDQQTLTADGDKFTAVEGVPGRCIGCAFPDGFGCAAWRTVKASLCRPGDRADGRGVIWVPSNTVNA